MNARGERGETLLELLMTVSIMGIAFIGILAGIGTTFMAGDSHRQNATAETVLRSYAERIKDPVDVPYVKCATTASYPTPIGFSLPAGGWSTSVTSVLVVAGEHAADVPRRVPDARQGRATTHARSEVTAR